MKKLQDHYFKKAKSQGYAARSVYKLETIDRKHNLLRRGGRVLELGCAPGSWTQYAADRLGTEGLLVAIDQKPLRIQLPSQVRIMQQDILAPAPELLTELGSAFDVVLSDMAPATSGIRAADASRSVDLARAALGLARRVLRPGGAVLVKVLQGGTFPQLRAEFKQFFERVSVEKPPASRTESVEVFLLGQGFR